jgi:uncharacterized Fe-S center protein
MTIKPSCKQLVNQIKNKGGRAFIYKFNKTFRLVMMLKYEDTMRIRVKFSAEDKAELFARRMLSSQRVALALSTENVHYINANNNITYYRVDCNAYKKSIVHAHDDLHLSYWYQLGSGKAFRNSSRSVSSWVT